MMLPVCLLTALLAGAEGDLSGAYEAAKARAGDGAEGHVRLALWCEQHGLDYERARNLALAVLKRPDDAKARGLLGMVKLDGRWREAAEAERRPAPEILAHYNARRAAIKPDRADDQAQLALWCERNGLRAEARAHWTAVAQREPSRETAWRHMGYKRHRGRWMTPEQIDAEIAEAKARQKADRHWGPEFNAVTAVFQRKPSATFRVVVGGDEVLTTGIHRFWLAGKGWAMARDLKPGDLVRTVKGVQRVESVTADEIRPVFNLAVDLARDFFVGSAGVLVHDDNLAEPVAAPFDAMTELAAAAPAVR